MGRIKMILRSLRIETIAASGENLIIRSCFADSVRAYRVGLCLLVSAVAVALAMVIATGGSHQIANSWDSAAHLDGAWRVYCGQRPHVDFSSPIGVVPHLLLAAGMWVVGPSANVLAYCPAVLCPILALCAWGLARPRLPALHATLLAILIAFLPIATFSLGYHTTFRQPSYAMQYNRMDWALLSLLILVTLFPPRQNVRRSRSLFEGLLAGAVLGLLAFNKINYFAMACFVSTLGLLINRHCRSAFYGMAFGLASVVLLFLTYLRFDVLAVIGDLQMLSGVQTFVDLLKEMALTLLHNLSAVLLVFALLVVALPVIANQDKTRPRQQWRIVVLGVLTCVVVGLAVCMANAQNTTIPTLAVASVLIAEGVRRSLGNDGGDSLTGPTLVDSGAGPRVLVVNAFAAYLCLAIILPDAASVTNSFFCKQAEPPEVAETARVRSEAMESICFPPTWHHSTVNEEEVLALLSYPQLGDFTAFEYARWVDNGLKLLRPHTDRQSVVFAMSTVNPFPFALQLPSPRFGVCFWQPQRLIDHEHHPTTEAIFAEVTHVMVPKRPIHIWHRSFLDEVYGPHIQTHFRQLAESSAWTLYIRDDRGCSQVTLAAEKNASVDLAGRES
jgi:hypothetical protein